jgi:TIR domain
MSLIFINYLTGDGDGLAVLLDRELSRTFGHDAVFRAGRSIPPGADWQAAIHTALRHSHALIAIIGPRWQRPVPPTDTPDPSPYWTHQEIQTALAASTRVIPILIDQTPRPTADTLPPALAALATRQYIRLDHTDIDSAITRLTTALADQIQN